MPYVGRDLSRGNYLKLDDLVSQFNGSTTTFNLTSGGSAFFPGSAFSILVSLGGIVQEPESAYTINKSQITFASAPLATDEFFIIALGVALGVGVPGHGTVGGSQLTKPLEYDDYFYLDSTNNRVGIHSATPTVALDVVGDIKLNGNLVTAGTGGGGFNAGVVTCTGLDVNGNADFSGNVSIGGTLTYLDVTNIDSVGIITAQQGIHLGTASTVGHLSTVGVSSIASLQVRDLTATHIAYAGANGRLTGSSNITYDGTTFMVAEPSRFSDDVFINVRGKSFKTSDWNIFNTTSGNALAISGGGAATEKIRINSDGEVGIGTDNPVTSLEVYRNDNAAKGIIQVTQDGTGDAAIDFQLKGTKEWTLGIDNSDGDNFKLASTAGLASNPVITVTTAGNVGINTTVPADILSLGAAANTLAFGCKDTTRSNHVWQLMNNDASGNAEFRMYKNSVSGTHAQSINFATSGDANYILDGPLLLGLTSPTYGSGDIQHEIKKNNSRGYTAPLMVSHSHLLLNNSDTSTSTFCGIGIRAGSGDGAIGFVYGNAANNADFVVATDGGSNGIERIRVTNSGALLVGTSVNSVFNGGRNARVQIEGTDSGTSALAIARNSNDQDPAYISLGKSKGTAVGSNTAVADDTSLGCIEFNGSDGSGSYNTHAEIRGEVDGTPGNSDAPGRIVFKTTPDTGSTTPVERLRIKSDGIIETGTAIGASGADSDQRLRVGRDGNCNISVRATASTTAYTGIDFGDSGDDRAGRIQYMHNGDYMSFHTNGAGSGSSNERLRINSTGELGIGVAAASGNQLHIKNGGTADAFAKIESESGYDAALLLDTSNGGGASADVRFQMDGSTKGSIQYVNNASSADANSMLFRTGNNSTKMQITTGGNVNIGGDYAQTTYTMKVTGSFAATTKSFVIDHPTKENHSLRYACLEGPENSVYIRGRSSDSIIELPDYWIGLVHDDSITVNVTPIGNKNVWVESINNNSVTIGSDDSTEYFYTVFAERKDVEKLEVEVEK